MTALSRNKKTAPVGAVSFVVYKFTKKTKHGGRTRNFSRNFPKLKDRREDPLIYYFISTVDYLLHFFVHNDVFTACIDGSFSCIISYDCFSGIQDQVQNK